MRTTASLVAGLLSALLAACGAEIAADAPAAPDELPVGTDDEVADDDLDEGDLVDDVTDDEGLDEEEVEGDVADDDVLDEEVIVDDGTDDEVDESGVIVDDVIVDDEVSDDLATGGAIAPTAVTKDLKVLHWNIAGGKENGCRTGGITRAVLRYVRQHDVDFVGLNEVCAAQYPAIREALRTHWGKGNVVFSAYVGDGTSRVVGNAIFSRRRFDTISKQKLGQDQHGDRFLLCGRVKALNHLRFCSTHLTPGDATARRQLTKVHDRIEGWWHDRKDTVILSGDLNITPNDQALNKVYAAAANTGNNPGNHGRYRELDDDDGNHCRGYGERSHAGNGGPCGQGGKIDFIFARANRLIGNYRGDTLTIPGDCTGACSDHRAVVGTARVRVRL